MLYPRQWHLGRTLLLVTWLTTTTSYLALFIGATYEGEGFSPNQLLLAQLVTQAALLIVALLSLYGKMETFGGWLSENPRLVIRLSFVLNAALLIGMAAAMRPWNDEASNLQQASFLASNGLSAWTANYETLNRWMGPHHPPLLALLYGLFYSLVGPHLVAGRLFNIVFSLAALAVGIRLVRRLADERTAALSSLCWLLFPIWLFNGAAALLESPFLLVLLLTVDAFITFLEGRRTAQAVIVGMWLSVGLLCRYNIVLLLPPFALALLLTQYRPLLRKPGTWWILGVPLLVLAPLAGMAAGSGLLKTQAMQMSWMALLLRPGGPHYLVEFLLPLWPLHIGAHLIPLFILAGIALYFGEKGDRMLLLLGGVFLASVVVSLPNPRYLLPTVPFIAAGMARVFQYIEAKRQDMTTAMTGIFAATITLCVLVVIGANLGDFYPFY